MLRHLPSGTYFGNRRRSRHIPGFKLTEQEYAPAFVIPQHAHATAYFGLIVEGGYRETYDRHSRECGPSTLLFHPRGEVHSEEHYDAAVRIFCLEPTEQILERLGEYGRALDGPLEFRGGPLVRLAAGLYREFRDDDGLSALAMEGIALEFLALAARRPGRRDQSAAPRWLWRVRDALHDRFREPVRLEELAEAVGVHPAHLARTFRRHYGCTVGDYVRNLRVERGREELQSTDRPLVEIALLLGYSDQSHFSTSFKRHTGMTPSAFRAQSRSKAQL
jgi:AraC family transcriptional regulator